MTNTTSAQPEKKKTQPNEYLAEVKDVCDTWLSTRHDASQALAQLFQTLLAWTVLSKGQKIPYHRGDSKHDFTLAGPRSKIKTPTNVSEMYQAVELRNGCFLHLVYTFEITAEKRVRTKSSRIVYQADAVGKKQIFRMDFERQPSTPYPAGHLHVYGTLPDYVNLPEKKGNKLHHIHFPIIRPNLESVIRLLVEDYGVPTNIAREDWDPVLKYTEDLFMDNFTKQPS